MKPLRHLVVIDTYYAPGAGVDLNSGSYITSETTGVKMRHRKAMTVKNLAAFFLNTGASSNLTVTSRKNGGNGALTCTIGTIDALGQDTSHSDSIAVGDDYDFSFAANVGPGNGDMITVDYISTVGDCIFSCMFAAGKSLNTSVTQYFGLSGSLVTGQTTETNAEVLVNSAFLFSQLLASVSSNTISTSSTLNLRANVGNTGISASITANTTGIFVDNTNTYQAATTDLMNYQIVTGSTGTSMKITQMSVWGNATAGAAAGGPIYQHFDNTTQSNRQNMNAFGGQIVIFG